MRNSLVVAFMFMLAGLNIHAQTWINIPGLHRSDIQGVFFHDGRLLAPTTYGGVYYSSDNGETWQSSNIGIEEKEIRGYSSDDNYLYVIARYKSVGARDSVFRSSDNGNTWANCKSKFANIIKQPIPSTFYFIAAAGSWLFLGVSESTYQSSDKGDTWLPIDSSNGVPNILWNPLVVVDTSIFARGPDGRIYHSIDDGISWKMLLHQESKDFRDTHLLYTFGNEIVIEAGNGIFYSSTDKGENWNRYFDTLPNIRSISLAKNETYTFIGTDGKGIYRYGAREGKKEFKFIGPKDNLTIKSLYFNGKTLYAVAGIGPVNNPANCGLYRSTDNGDTWQLLDFYHEVRTLYSGTKYMFAGTDGGSAYMLDNRRWQSQALAAFSYRTAEVNALDEYDDWLYAATGTGVYGASIDLPDQDAVLDNGMGDPVVTSLVREGDMLFAATKSTRTVVSQSGTTVTRIDNIARWNSSEWKLARTGLPTHITITALTNFNSLLIAGTSTGIYRSKNKGDTWEPAMTGMGEMAVNGFAISDGRLFTATDNGVYYSDDGGGSWVVPSHGFPHKVLSLAVDEGMAMAGTDGNGLYRSTDNGNTWQAVGDVMGDKTITAMLLHYPLLTVATQTKGTFSHQNALLLPVTDNDTMPPDLEEEITIFPNPARNQVVISPKGAVFSNGYTAMLYDNLGKPIHTAVAGPKEQLLIGTSDIAIGVYYLVIQSGSATAIRLISVTH